MTLVQVPSVLFLRLSPLLLPFIFIALSLCSLSSCPYCYQPEFEVPAAICVPCGLRICHIATYITVLKRCRIHSKLLRHASSLNRLHRQVSPSPLRSLLALPQDDIFVSPHMPTYPARSAFLHFRDVEHRLMAFRPAPADIQELPNAVDLGPFDFLPDNMVSRRYG